MTILEALVKLRNDLKIWCINNFNQKLNKTTAMIEMNSTGELPGFGGFIDFHYHDANGVETGSADYSSRIIEEGEGLLCVNGVVFNAKAITPYSKVMTDSDIIASTTDLTAGSSPLATGKLYIVYE